MHIRLLIVTGTECILFQILIFNLNIPTLDLNHGI